MPARRAHKAGYKTKAWRERTLKQDEAQGTGEMRQKEVMEALPEPGEPS